MIHDWNIIAVPLSAATLACLRPLADAARKGDLPPLPAAGLSLSDWETVTDANGAVRRLWGRLKAIHRSCRWDARYVRGGCTNEQYREIEARAAAKDVERLRAIWEWWQGQQCALI